MQRQQTKYPPKKTLITCHANADFDALCSLVGVSLLFPHAQVVFSGTQEKILQEFYEDFITPLFDCVSPKDADYQDIERLVVVDTQCIDRLMHIKPLLLTHGLLDLPTTSNNSNNNNTIEHQENSRISKGIIPFDGEFERQRPSSQSQFQSQNNTPPPLEILVWDHHSTATLRADGGTHALVGATCTLIVEELKEVFGNIPCVFASLLGIGIYVDTGSFSYTSTTARDYQAAAWLLGNGFLPEIVTSYTTRHLSLEQFSLLNHLVETAQIIDAVALRFIIATARTEEYVNDLASLIPPFLDMNPCQVLFMLVDMGEGVQIIARSKDESFDVARICRLLGGGGHAYAASTMVKDMLLPELITFIETEISLFAHTDKVARRLMTSPVVYAYNDSSMEQAEQIMSHYRLKAIPIFRRDTKICVGLLEHEVALRAVGHGLSNILVSAYMQRNFKVVTQETNLQNLIDIIIGENQRIVPVIQEELPIIEPTYSQNQLEEKDLSLVADDSTQNKIRYPSPKILHSLTQLENSVNDFETTTIGVITRTDLIRLFLDDEEVHLPKPKLETVRKRNLSKMIQMYTPTPCVKLLEIAGKVATEEGLNLYVVGGFVRDLLMKQQEFRWPNMDIDLVVEGDAIAFAHKLAILLNGRVREHTEFLTALLIFNPQQLDYIYENIFGISAQSKKNSLIKEKNTSIDFEIRIDIATARLEYYESPAALPTVELSSIRMDLARRDFTINAMAIQLNKDFFGQLVDFFDGQNDIKNKRIRMLHSLSFVEDPTRALRAVRFEQRYNFKAGPHCDKLIRNAVELKLIDKLSGKRIYTELSLILKEEDSLSCFLRLQDFNILTAIHPALDLSNKEKLSFMEECHKVRIWYTLLYLEEKIDNMVYYVLANSRTLSHKDLKELLERLAFIPTKVEEILDIRSKLIRAVGQMEKWALSDMRMSALHNILKKIPIEGLLFLSARKPKSDIDDNTEEMFKRLSLYIYKARLEKLELRGEDLILMGVEQGPDIGLILNDVLMAKMDSIVAGYEEEWAYAKKRADFYKNTHRSEMLG